MSQQMSMTSRAVHSLQALLSKEAKQHVPLLTSFEAAKTPAEATLYTLATMKKGSKITYWNKSNQPLNMARERPMWARADSNVAGDVTFVGNTSFRIHVPLCGRGHSRDIKEVEYDVAYNKIGLAVPTPPLAKWIAEDASKLKNVDKAIVSVPSGVIRISNPNICYEHLPVIRQQQWYFGDTFFLARDPAKNPLFKLLNGRRIVQGKDSVFVDVFGDEEYPVCKKSTGLEVLLQENLTMPKDRLGTCDVTAYGLCIADATKVHEADFIFGKLIPNKKNMADAEYCYAVKPGTYAITKKKDILHIARVT